MALALRTIASMGLLRHGFHKLFLAMASSKQWGLWVGFVGFMAVGFGEEEKMGFVGRRERLLYWKCLQEKTFTQWLKWVKMLLVSLILESQWLRPT